MVINMKTKFKNLLWSIRWFFGKKLRRLSCWILEHEFDTEYPHEQECLICDWSKKEGDKE